MMPTSKAKEQNKRPAPQSLHHQVEAKPILPPPNKTSQHPMIPSHPTDLTLPIPSPHLYYDNYHHPWFPAVLPNINRFVTPELYPFRFPEPLGPLKTREYNLLGVSTYDFDFVNKHPSKTFTKWLLWYLEINDHLLRLICPADLNDMPCEWDELQGGCPMLRLCTTKKKYIHPHLALLPRCTPATRFNCMYIHDVEPSCRSIAKQVAQMHYDMSFRSWQLCEVVARGEICWWGHDLESGRVEALYRYWNHRNQARAKGSIGVIKTDVNSVKIWKPRKPQAAPRGKTFHGVHVVNDIRYIESFYHARFHIRPDTIPYPPSHRREQFERPRRNEDTDESIRGRRKFLDSAYASENAD